ncbi:MAG: hypothetical protein GY827_00815 [Cytophagales bacterium]|nr:hypothetical protein [Cytophagales bacterium]
MKNQWLFSRKIDLLWLGLPVWLSWVFCFLLPQEIHQFKMPIWAWAIFILGIDVSHVWSTIWRTYFDKQEFKSHKKTLILAPICAFVGIMLITQVSTFFFWRILAYIALFHFIKQQYGFFALYRAKYKHKINHRFLKDKFVIYFSMLYPVFHWHLNGNRLFNWFINGDFVTLKSYLLQLGLTESFFIYFNGIANTIYWLILIIWLIEEIYQCKKHKLELPFGKIIWLFGTGMNWYLGIVYFNSDIAFSVTNVVAHGIPYCILVFIYVEKKKELVQQKSFTIPKWVLHISMMLIAILIFAFVEEYFWDLFLWREKTAFFGTILHYPTQVIKDPLGQRLVIALLSIPQVTHYIIDGFIWKNNDKNPFLKPVLFS